MAMSAQRVGAGKTGLCWYSEYPDDFERATSSDDKGFVRLTPTRKGKGGKGVPMARETASRASWEC